METRVPNLFERISDAIKSLYLEKEEDLGHETTGDFLPGLRTM